MVDALAKLYLASLCGLRFNPLMKATYGRLCLRGKTKMCAIGTLMRKLVHWCHGVLKTQKPFGVGCLSSYARSAWKAALRCCIWHRSKTAEARRKPVLIDRFHLTHPGPAKPYPLSAMTELLCAVGVVPTRVYLRVSGPSGPLTSVY